MAVTRNAMSVALAEMRPGKENRQHTATQIESELIFSLLSLPPHGWLAQPQSRENRQMFYPFQPQPFRFSFLSLFVDTQYFIRKLGVVW